MELKGNTVLITGGTSGIGFELAKQLLGLGNQVIVTGRDPKRIARAQALLSGAQIFQSDVSKASEIRALYDKVAQAFPKLNVLVNNAGIMKAMNFQKVPDDLDALTQEIDVNLKGPIQMIKTFLPLLKAQPKAAILNVGSGLAFVPLPLSPIYCATKAALHSFSMSLRVQLRNTSIQVFEVTPPATGTELMDKMEKDDMKGVPIMKVEELVRRTLSGMSKDQLEIRPGQAAQLRMMGRIAPDFIFKQLSKSVDRILSK